MNLKTVVIVSAVVAMISMPLSGFRSAKPYNEVVDITGRIGTNTKPTTDHFPLGLMIKINCGDGTGTAWVIDQNILVTASHVVVAGECDIDGAPTTTIVNNVEKDYAFVTVPLQDSYRIPTSCHAKPEEHYVFGYAGGDALMGNRLQRTNHRFDRPQDDMRDLVVYHGASYPGMSGGPVFNRNGEAVGILIGIIKLKSGDQYTVVREFADIPEICG